MALTNEREAFLHFFQVGAEAIMRSLPEGDVTQITIERTAVTVITGPLPPPKAEEGCSDNECEGCC